MPKRKNDQSIVDLASLSRLTPDDEGIIRLPVKLKKEQLNESFLVSTNDKQDMNEMYTYKWATCAICLEPVQAGTDGVYLACKQHAFHGKCIVPHLQQDRRCPTCRFAPKSRKEQADDDAAQMFADEEDDDDDESDDSYDEDESSSDDGSEVASTSGVDTSAIYDDNEFSVNDAFDHCTERLLLAFDIHMLNEALSRYGVGRITNRRRAAKALAQQLFYETDDE